MTEDKNKTIAVFRFGVIHEFVGGAVLSSAEKRRLIRDKCARKWMIPYSSRTRISENTLYRWIRRYRSSGGRIESLYPRTRNDRGKPRILAGEAVAAIVNARKERSHVPVKLLLTDLKRRNLIPQKTGLTTLYRVLHQAGLMEKSSSPEDRRKFEASLPNDIWQSDVMHGPKVLVDGTRRKTYLIAFLDDHSRLVPFAGFYLSENLTSFMDAFEKALVKRGLPRKLYVDNGPAYRSHKLEFTCASLAIALIHARPYKPQGKGKIERFFRTVRSDFLPVADTSSLDQINASLNRWIDDAYHQRKHTGTGMTPFGRFSRNLSCIRQAPRDLKNHFRKAVYRRVAKDRTVTLDGRLYEAPVVLIGKRILLLYHEKAPARVEALWGQKSHGFLTPVDLNVNCRVKRDRNHHAQLESASGKPYTGGGLWK